MFTGLFGIIEDHLSLSPSRFLKVGISGFSLLNLYIVLAVEPSLPSVPLIPSLPSVPLIPSLPSSPFALTPLSLYFLLTESQMNQFPFSPM